MHPIVFIAPDGAYVYDPTAESREGRVRRIAPDDPILTNACSISISQFPKPSQNAN
jgi:hypothetical protein